MVLLKSPSYSHRTTLEVTVEPLSLQVNCSRALVYLAGVSVQIPAIITCMPQLSMA